MSSQIDFERAKVHIGMLKKKKSLMPREVAVASYDKPCFTPEQRKFITDQINEIYGPPAPFHAHPLYTSQLQSLPNPKYKAQTLSHIISEPENYHIENQSQMAIEEKPVLKGELAETELLEVQIMCYTEAALRCMTELGKEYIVKGLESLFAHIMQYHKSKRLSLDSFPQSKSFHLIEVEKGEKTDVRLEPLLYQLVPNDIDLKLSKPLTEGMDLRIYRFEISQDKKKIEEQPQVMKSFINMLCYFNGKKSPFFSSKEINGAKERLIQNSNGLQVYANQIFDKLASSPFTSCIGDNPKGLLFHGPPRVGKTFVSKKLIQFLELFTIHPDLAAGDFNKPYVGQGEEMINKITERCEVLPWELCVLFIDEIDGLAPNRKGAAGEHKIDLLSVFLSVMDGNKKKKNLFMIGTSNRLKQMDDAFLQRFDIKIFIGFPDSAARESWIRNEVEKTCQDFPKCAKYLSILTKPKICEHFLLQTVNFTADAMKKCLSEVQTTVKNYYEQNLPLNDAEVCEIVVNTLIRICESDKLYLSKHFISSLMRSLGDFVRFEEIGPLSQFFIENRCDPLFASTGRILIDLNEQDPKQQILVEMGLKKYIPQFAQECYYKLNEVYQMRRGLNENDLNVCLLGFDKMMKNLIENGRSDSSTLENIFLKKTLFEDLVVKRAKCKYVGCKQIFSKEEAYKIFLLLINFLGYKYIIIIDSAYFLKNGINNDESQSKEISFAVEEALQYESCFIIFDLDSIAGVQKKYSNIKNDLKYSVSNAYSSDRADPDFSYEIKNPLSFKMALEYLFNGLSDNSRDHWLIAISSHNHLISEFKEKCNWPKSETDIKNELLIEKLNENVLCRLCHEYFNEKNNDENSCGSHHGELFLVFESEHLYNSSFKTKIEASQGEIARNLYTRFLQERRKYSEYEAQTEIQRGVPADQFKWTCCGKSIYEKGEVKGSHQRESL